MFGRFFRKKKNTTPSNERNLFDELFPLTGENKKLIESKTDTIQKQMSGEEGFFKLRNYSRAYEFVETKLNQLYFDSLGWEHVESSETSTEFENSYGDFLTLNIVEPNGEMVRGESQIEVYRNWLRDLFVKQEGGLISCEEFESSNGLIAYESITKCRREGATGIDYVYLMNISSFEEQKLYQLMIKVFEMEPTGMRDNIFIHPLCDVLGIGMEKIHENYRQDPYDKDFKAGNTMNLSEREEFDYLFPFHALSIIRREIQPRIRKSLRFEEK